MPWSCTNNRTSVTFEPFKIRAIDPIKLNTKEYRIDALKKVYYNPFALRSEDVIIDLLTDSGLSAMSTQQWAGMIKSEEAYVGSSSYEHFHSAVAHMTNYPEIIPAHQGRAAERILFQALSIKKFSVVIANGFFDTTRCALENLGCTILEYPQPDTEDPNDTGFKGNMDIDKTKQFLQIKTLRIRRFGTNKVDPSSGSENYRVALVIMSMTNSHLAGQPVSMKNLSKVSQLCKNHNIPLFLDACRYAENVYHVKRKEPGYENKSLIEICREMFALADGCFVSMKKDGLCNTGGFLALKSIDLAERCRENIVINEGFPNYGGLTGRDMEAMAQGLVESLNEDFLNYHVTMIEDFGHLLAKMEIPVMLPTAGYAVYVNASDILPGIKRSQHPAWTLVCALYIEGGIRACEIGSIMQVPEGNDVKPELVRLSIPRRVYTFAHLQFVADTLKYIQDNRDKYSMGYEILEESDIMRHFSIKLRPLLSNASLQKTVPEERASRKTQNNSGRIGGKSSLMVKEIDSRSNQLNPPNLKNSPSKISNKLSELNVDAYFEQGKTQGIPVGKKS